ncbi:MAG: serine acetyltransferase [Planctomycetes bacterium SM23_25]|nr:MAG: serine acetyltransferase [Planctomycetes bacterium SM23_25]
MPSAPGREENIPEIIGEIVGTYDEISTINHLGLRSLPSREAVSEIIDGLREILYPGYFGRRHFTPQNIRYHIGDRIYQVYRLLTEQIYLSVIHECRRTDGECDHCNTQATRLAVEFMRRLPQLRRILEADVRAAYDGDPAARSLDEIIFSYPGLAAVTVYRLAHELWEMKVPLLPRIMTEIAHASTGIDIHPGARIGERFFIDHGTGVVIGETTEIGNDVRIYQGVTLGAMSFPKDETGQLIRGKKRHPTIEDGVTIYSGATLLGGETVVGRGSTIGGNVWLTTSVPPHSIIMIEEPALVVEDKAHKKSVRQGGGKPAAKRKK